MRWEEYYDKIGQWATSTAVSRISTLETFGPGEEIVEIIDELALEDEKGAARLLKKAIAAGVKFTGRQYFIIRWIFTFGKCLHFTSSVI